MPEDEQVLHDELEKMVSQELTAKAMNDVSRQAFKEEKRKIASQKKAAKATSTNTLSIDRPFVSTDRSNTPYVSAASTPTCANAGESSFVYLGGKIPIDASTLPNADLPIYPNMPDLEDASDTLPNDGIFNGAYDDDEDVGAEADFNNMDNTIAVSPIPTLIIHKDYLKGQILGDPTLAVQTRGTIQKASSAQQALKNPILYHKPYKMKVGLKQCKRNCFSFNYRRYRYLLNFVPYGKKVTGIKWVFRNKRDERSIVVKNKARLVAQGFRQEEGIDYDECIFMAPIEEEVYVQSTYMHVDPAHPNKVYKVIKALYGLHQSPRAWYETLSSFLMENGFRRVKQQHDGIFISQDKYVADILKKFDFLSIRTEASIESDLLFDDADGIDSLPNQAIFDANSAKWNSNSYLRDILGDILGKDMYYPLRHVCKAHSVSLCIRGTLNEQMFTKLSDPKPRTYKWYQSLSRDSEKEESLDHKQTHFYKMSQPANDEFSQHLSDEESNHEDASDTGAAPKQQQQMIPQTTAISNIKLPNAEEGGNGNSKKRISTGKDGIVRVLSPVTAAEIQAVEKERKAKNILLMAIPKEHMRRFHGMDDAKEIWEAIRTRFQQLLSIEDANHTFLRSLPPAWSNLAMTMRTNPEIDNLSIDDLYNNLRVFEQEIQILKKWTSQLQIAMDCYSNERRNVHQRVTHDGKKKRDSLYQQQETGKQEKNQMGLLTMDDGIVNWGEHTEAEEINHALMAISSRKEENFKGMKAVKEKEQLQKTMDSWKDSSKNLWKLIDSGMSSNSKVGLGFEIKSNNEKVLKILKLVCQMTILPEHIYLSIPMTVKDLVENL
ncbi:hypothetical protein Tco_0122038 [Tanacetum coccineum]